LRSIDVPADLLGDIKVNLLENIGGIEPGRNSGIEAKLNHVAQPRTIVVEQDGQRIFLASAEALQPLNRLWRLINHHACTLYRENADFSSSFHSEERTQWMQA
jgi:hypothetical protein